MYFCNFVSRLLKTFFKYLLLILFIAGRLLEAKNFYHGNLHECILYKGVQNCNASSAGSSKMSTGVLLESEERLVEFGAESVAMPLEYIQGGQHAVKLGLGTPEKSMTFSIATLTDVSWVQCEPCSMCYPQSEPIFNSSNSSSFRNVSWRSRTCDLLETNYFGSFSTTGCDYKYRDWENSDIEGTLSTDVLALNEKVLIRWFAFGCGRANYLRSNVRVAGYLGLGSGPLSFLNRTADKYNETFSYCLPGDAISSGFLIFGGSASKSAQFVPFSNYSIYTLTSDSYYVLDLAGISINGKSLDFGYSLSFFSTTRFVLDSTITVTRLEPDIYKVLRSDFRKRMSNYPMLQESISPDFDTCYDLSGYQNLSVPSIAFHFANGVVLPLGSSGILYAFNSTVSCFPFSTTRDHGSGSSIFGTFQQSAFEIIFDNPNNRIGFGDGCYKEGSFRTIAIRSKAPVTQPFLAVIALYFVLFAMLLDDL